MDIKIIFAITSVVVTVWAFFIYIRDTFSKSTQPHIYTWLIWTITQGTATAGLWYGGGRLGAIELTIGTSLVFSVFLISLKRGSRNITKSDTITLAFALLAIVVWWQLKNPIPAVIMATTIDIIGYIPSIRKSWEEPWSETATTWFIFTLGNVFAILSLGEYNFLTLTYLVSISIVNVILAMICLSRRPHVSTP